MDEKDIDFIREDLENNLGYTKIMMLGNLLKELKKKNLTMKEINDEICKFRIEKGWDIECPQCKGNAHELQNKKGFFFCIKCNQTIQKDMNKCQ